MSSSRKFEWSENICFTEAALHDLFGFDHSQQIVIFKALQRVAENPRPQPAGYGKPLGNDLTGYLKVKLKSHGIRIIYRLVPPDSNNMEILIIGLRADDEVYEEAVRRK